MDKDCDRCGEKFSKPNKLSGKQWEKRKFCSKKCSGMRIDTPYDVICDMYTSGMTAENIARSIGISGTHVVRIIRSCGIVTRDIGSSISIGHSNPETRKKMSDAKLGKPLSDAAKEKLRSFVGPKRKSWKGGVTTSAGGYLMYTSSPENGDRANRLVHRVIVEEHIGMRLNSDIHVHHKDRDKQNNDISNLEPMSASLHMKHHIECGDLEWRNKC